MPDGIFGKDTVRIDVVSDVVCPWCFIGKRRLEKALALKPDVPVEVHRYPYFLNDWIPREGISRDRGRRDALGDAFVALRHGQDQPAAQHARYSTARLVRSAPSVK
jgi:predicted DsbA family dithiol-disulfide isomerase